jgi:hypothetical protein
MTARKSSSLALTPKIQNGEMPNLHFDLCLLIIGFLCAIIWGLVLWGSKAWYEHWEIMICFLEDDITGPLYKTGTYRKTRKYYSVSKLNIMLAWIYIIVFAGLLAQYLYGNYVPAKRIDAIDWFCYRCIMCNFRCKYNTVLWLSKE